MNFRSQCLLTRFASVFGLALVLGLVSGCRSDRDLSAPDDYASVWIRGHTADEIRQAAITAFKAEGFHRPDSSAGDDLVFEKQGSEMDTFKYGGWMGGLWWRVKVSIESMDDHTLALRCEAFAVTDHDDNLVEQENKLSSAKRKYFQKILQNARDSLAFSKS